MQKDTVKKPNIALEVKNVSKSFRLPIEQANGLKQAVLNWIKGIKGYKEQRVLKDISFTVEEGDFFGIVGRNGSGKSTLLKLISQIYTPDKGSIEVNGKLVPFIELGVGFNPELTGRENVYLNGALLGFSHEEVSAMYSEIVEFAELEEFMDQKLKNYSSGMQVRLAFSIAIKADADVLVLDEVLAVGDAAFQRKCFEYFSKLKRNNKTVILVTHDMESVRKYCNKAILIDKGEVIRQGSDINEVADGYLQLFNESPEDNKSDPDEGSGRWGTREIIVDSFTAKITKDNLVIDMNIKANKTNNEGLILAVRVIDIDGAIVAGSSTRTLPNKDLYMSAGESRALRFELPNNFGREVLFVGYHMVDLSNTVVYDSYDFAVKVNNPARSSYYPVVYDNAVKVIRGDV